MKKNKEKGKTTKRVFNADRHHKASFIIFLILFLISVAAFVCAKFIESPFLNSIKEDINNLIAFESFGFSIISLYIAQQESENANKENEKRIEDIKAFLNTKESEKITIIIKNKAKYKH